MTSDDDWDSTIYDNTISDTGIWYGAVSKETISHNNPNFDQIGNYRYRTVANHHTYYFQTAQYFLIRPLLIH